MLGFLATVALLGSGAAIAYMVLPKDEDGAAVQAPPAAKPKANPKPALTKAQRRERNAAVTVLEKEGYEPARMADWRPKAELQVLVGRNDQGAMRAFFFTDGKFLGHDDAIDQQQRPRGQGGEGRHHALLPREHGRPRAGALQPRQRLARTHGPGPAVHAPLTA